MQVGPGWGESLAPPGAHRQSGTAQPSRLSMEDEDAAEESEETLGVMRRPRRWSGWSAQGRGVEVGAEGHDVFGDFAAHED